MRRLLGPVLNGILAGMVAGSMIFLVPWLRIVEETSQKDIIQILLTIVLAAATLFYALRTKDIASATRDLAKATATSVAEMVKQRQLSTQPWVIPDLTPGREKRSVTNPVPVKNIGRGPAIRIKATVFPDGDPARIGDEWKRRTGPSDSLEKGPSWPFLEPGDSETWDSAFKDQQTSGRKGVIAVQYEDIYGREILSGWAYRIEKADGGGLVVEPGDPVYPVLRKEKDGST